MKARKWLNAPYDFGYRIGYRWGLRFGAWLLMEPKDKLEDERNNR